jgi:hypothetical protein
MPCCTPRDSDAVGEQQWHASDVCGGCKAIETPTAPSLEAPQAIELAWFAPRRIAPGSAIDVVYSASNPFERGARTNATGPPGDTGSIPLRL